jgi:hypothetical protein
MKGYPVQLAAVSMRYQFIFFGTLVYWFSCRSNFARSPMSIAVFAVKHVDKRSAPRRSKRG